MSDARAKLQEAILELIQTGSYGRTTVDHICEKAGVNKGSFYHFFSSKSELAVIALADAFRQRRVGLDAIFSPLVLPLDRLRKFCRYAREWQADLLARHGRVLGCPLHAIGAEVSSAEPALCAQIQEIMGQYRQYLVSAIRDAQTAGLIHVTDVNAKAEMIFAYYEGLLTQARIQNNLAGLEEMEAGTMSLLGVAEPARPR